MGRFDTKKLIVLTACFLFTSFMVYRQPASIAVKKNMPLKVALDSFNGWRNQGNDILDLKIIDTLKLDDYLNQYYSKESKKIFLYIGYYHTLKKIGDAHDPLVCFPGQGWLLSNKKTGKFTLNHENGLKISYTTMTAKLGLNEQFILYWFQSFDQTSADTLSQKITSIRQKYVSGREDNAFVRISIPFDKNHPDNALKVMREFVMDFYPPFLDYIKSGETVSQ